MPVIIDPDQSCEHCGEEKKVLVELGASVAFISLPVNVCKNCLILAIKEIEAVG